MPRPSRLPRAGLPSFRGGWVALSGAGPVGKGLTADDARTSAKLSRLKVLTQVIFFPTDSSEPLELPAIFDRAREALPESARGWLVGGAGGTGRVVAIDDEQRFFLDFAALRGEYLNADLAARDFTVNAIAVDLAGHILDPMGGRADLRAKLLRACGPTSFDDDPVRALRAIRLAAQLDFHVERGTREAARKVVGRLASASAERVRDEF